MDLYIHVFEFTTACGSKSSKLCYLTGRKQRVVLSGHVSELMSVLAGVPQGSILGPLFFLIYINDIVKNLGCSIACSLMIRVCTSL